MNAPEGKDFEELYEKEMGECILEFGPLLLFPPTMIAILIFCPVAAAPVAAGRRAARAIQEAGVGNLSEKRVESEEVERAVAALKDVWAAADPRNGLENALKEKFPGATILATAEVDLPASYVLARVRIDEFSLNLFPATKKNIETQTKGEIDAFVKLKVEIVLEDNHNKISSPPAGFIYLSEIANASLLASDYAAELQNIVATSYARIAELIADDISDIFE